jgi:hypothetical protein
MYLGTSSKFLIAFTDDFHAPPVRVHDCVHSTAQWVSCTGYCLLRAFRALRVKFICQLQRDWTEPSQPLCRLTDMAYKSSETLVEVTIRVAIPWHRRLSS